MSKKKKGIHDQAVEAVAALLLTATYNRFGKPEWLTDEGREAREKIRILSIKMGVTTYANHGTVIEQAGAVLNASAHFEARLAQYESAIAGCGTWSIALAFNKLRPGMDFRGLNRSALRDVFLFDGLETRSVRDLKKHIVAVEMGR